MVGIKRRTVQKSPIFKFIGRTKKYPQLFNRSGATVSLAGHSITKLIKSKTASKSIIKTAGPNKKDEHYVLDICDKILNKPAKQWEVYLVNPYITTSVKRPE